MTTFLFIALFIPAAIAFALSVFLLIEVLGALLPVRQAPSGAAPSVAVVIPAHNEAGTIEPTINDVKAQLRPGDRMIVVADNCDDNTGEIAMRAGATVLLRNDTARRGKGYALQFALDALKQNPPGAVVFLDADCRVEAEAIQKLAGATVASDRPVQALYQMTAPAGAPPARAVSEFAWTMINRVRMAGLFTLFDVTRLTGSGMAFPWSLAEQLDLASDEIVEDLALSVKTIKDNAAPVFRPDIHIMSEFPLTEEGADHQRARWEHGSLRLAAARAPGLLASAIGKRDIRLAAAALDLAIPPLTLFAASIGIVLVLSAMAYPIGVETPFRLTGAAAALFASAVFIAWLFFGRKNLPLSLAGAAFSYLTGKRKVYGAGARQSTTAWTRTARDKHDSADRTADDDNGPRK